MRDRTLKHSWSIVLFWYNGGAHATRNHGRESALLKGTSSADMMVAGGEGDGTQVR
jgi:hypothetical protein